MLSYADGSILTVYNASAPDATLRSLLLALIVGVLAIFPAIGYLLYVFKRSHSVEL
jgi:cytochrome bd-type quinol oxidase subunit 2